MAYDYKRIATICVVFQVLTLSSDETVGLIFLHVISQSLLIS
jgi:hypothetical protein